MIWTLGFACFHSSGLNSLRTWKNHLWMGEVPAYQRVPSKQALAWKILQFPTQQLNLFFGVLSMSISSFKKSGVGCPKKNLTWNLFKGPRMNSIPTWYMSFCRRRLDSRRANLSKFPGQHVLSNVRESQKMEKMEKLKPFRVHHIKKKATATLSSEKPSWFGFHPMFYWQDPQFAWRSQPFAGSIVQTWGKTPNCGSGLKRNGVFSIVSSCLGWL